MQKNDNQCIFHIYSKIIPNVYKGITLLKMFDTHSLVCVMFGFNISLK